MALTPDGKSIVFCMTKGGIARLDIDTKGRVHKATKPEGVLAFVAQCPMRWEIVQGYKASSGSGNV